MTGVVKPPTDGDLFDLLHRLFGIGDYSDDDKLPWWRFRILEIGKLKAMRRKRRLTVADLMVTAYFCDAHNFHIAAPWQLVNYLPAAKHNQQEWRDHQLERDVAEAIAYERALPEPDYVWADRLLLARGKHREELLAEWRQHRAPTDWKS
jgi:hypothetical protein